MGSRKGVQLASGSCHQDLTRHLSSVFLQRTRYNLGLVRSLKDTNVYQLWSGVDNRDTDNTAAYHEVDARRNVVVHYGDHGDDDIQRKQHRNASASPHPVQLVGKVKAAEAVECDRSVHESLEDHAPAGDHVPLARDRSCECLSEAKSVGQRVD